MRTTCIILQFFYFTKKSNISIALCITMHSYHTHRNIFFEILLNQIEIRLYLPFSDSFGSKRTSVWIQIYLHHLSNIFTPFICIHHILYYNFYFTQKIRIFAAVCEVRCANVLQIFSDANWQFKLILDFYVWLLHSDSFQVFFLLYVSETFLMH